MAQKVQIILEDDLDGGEADETVSFALDGTSYEIDLNESNASAMREALATYVGHARKVTGTRSRRSSAKSTSSGPSPKEVREWARENGHSGSDSAALHALPEFQKVIKAAVDRTNKDLSVIEKVRKFALADAAFTVENDQMTPTLKIRRPFIRQQYQDRLDALY